MTIFWKDRFYDYADILRVGKRNKTDEKSNIYITTICEPKKKKRMSEDMDFDAATEMLDEFVDAVMRGEDIIVRGKGLAFKKEGKFVGEWNYKE